MRYSIPVAVNCVSPVPACPALFISARMVAARSASRAFPPGLFEGTSYETLTMRLSPGDSVLFCTDGITPGWRAVRARAPPGPLQASAPFIASGNIGKNFFRGSRFLARPRTARRYGSSPVPLLRLVDNPAMCSHRHVESGQKAPGMRLTALVLSSNYDRYR